MRFLPDKNTMKLLRIPFSFFLMPVFILALSQVKSPAFGLTCCVFFIIHLLVYPASNGYNSYIDRDESSIGGLKSPPMPTKQLFYTTLIMDLAAVLVSFILISPLFSLCIACYILASRAYSSKQVRLKKYAFAGFLTVVIFQGAFTFYMCTIGITGSGFIFSRENSWLLLACSFQIAGAYPLTQVYQHKEDLADGVTTLSYKLGYTGTFIFTALMFAVCNVFYYLYFKATQKTEQFMILQLFFLPVIFYFLWWFFKVLKNTANADFKNTMRMNALAAVCMNTCFVVLYFINH